MQLMRRYNLDAPQGRSRTLQRQHQRDADARLGPVDAAADGMERTYRWIYDRMMAPAGDRRVHS